MFPNRNVEMFPNNNVLSNAIIFFGAKFVISNRFYIIVSHRRYLVE